MHRVKAHHERDRGHEPDPFEEVHRRHDEVADLIVEAIEAEEFQSAAMRLRECLIALIGAVRRRVELSVGGSLRTLTCRAGTRC